MTTADWIAVGALAFFVIMGIVKGFLRSVVSLIIYIAVALFSSVAAAFVGRWLVLNTNIYEYVVNRVVEANALLALVAKDLAVDVIYGVSFFVVALLVILLLIISKLFAKIVDHIPVVNGFNRLLGIIPGVIKFLLFSWLFFFLVDTFQTTNLGVILKGYITYGSFTSYIYRNNALKDLIFSLISVLTR